MADLNMDLSQTEEWSRGVIPAGDYHVKIVSDEVKQTSRGVPYLNLRYTVMDGPKKKACVFDKLYFWPPASDNARNAAQRKLKSIAKAIRHPNPNYIGNTSELLGGELVIRVKVSTSEQYDDQNEVSSYFPIKGVTTPAPQAAPTAPAAPAAPTQPQSAPQPAPQPQPQQEAPSEDVRAPWER